MIVNEHIHHHIHHVVQPVIEKESWYGQYTSKLFTKCFTTAIDKHRIHTTIPIHEVTHEAPLIHQSQSHDPVPIEHFLKHGGTLEGSVQPKDASAMLLHQGQYVREVDGAAERLEKELHLDNSNVRGYFIKYLTSDVHNRY